MRLEILIDSEEPIIYPLNKSKLVIGSSESADIIINVDGVSRKHLVLSVENDQYAVTDQGSTNGTYINEERLIPGKKVDFTSFFPVRLGDRVLLSLLSDDEDSPFSALQEAVRKERTNPAMKAPSASSEDDGSTRLLNLKQLQQSQATKKLTEQRKKVIQDKKAGRPIGKKTKKEPTSDKQRMILTQLFVVAVVAGAIYFQFFDEGDVVPESVAPVEQVASPTSAPEASPATPPIVLIPEGDLLSIGTLAQLSQGIKCTTASEKSLCDSFFPRGIPQHGGVIESPGFMNVFIEETSYYEVARVQMGASTPEALQKSPYSADDWKKLAYVVLIATKLSIMTEEQTPKKPVNYVFYNTENGQMRISGVLTLRYENLAALYGSVRPTTLKTAKEYGLFTLDSVLKYTQIY